MAVWMPVTVVPTSLATVAIDTFITDVSSVMRNWADASVSRISPPAVVAAPVPGRSAAVSARRRGPTPLGVRPSDLDEAASEGVDPAPPPRDVQQLEAAEGVGDGRVDDEVVADGLEPEQGAQQEQGRPRGPGLGAAGRRVLHGVLRLVPRVAAESLR